MVARKAKKHKRASDGAGSSRRKPAAEASVASNRHQSRTRSLSPPIDPQLREPKSHSGGNCLGSLDSDANTNSEDRDLESIYGTEEDGTQDHVSGCEDGDDSNEEEEPEK